MVQKAMRWGLNVDGDEKEESHLHGAQMAHLRQIKGTSAFLSDFQTLHRTASLHLFYKHQRECNESQTSQKRQSPARSPSS